MKNQQCEITIKDTELSGMVSVFKNESFWVDECYDFYAKLHGTHTEDGWSCALTLPSIINGIIVDRDEDKSQIQKLTQLVRRNLKVSGKIKINIGEDK